MLDLGFGIWLIFLLWLGLGLDLEISLEVGIIFKAMVIARVIFIFTIMI